jgi:hypothetical protein
VANLNRTFLPLFQRPPLFPAKFIIIQSLRTQVRVAGAMALSFRPLVFALVKLLKEKHTILRTPQ